MTLEELALPLRSHWRLALGVPLAAAVASLFLLLLLPRTYDARVVFAAIGPNRELGGLGALQALAGGFQGRGATASPEFVQALLGSHRVLTAAGLASPPGSSLPLIDRLAGSPIATTKIAHEMTRFVSVRVNRATGLITLHIIHADSGLARLAAEVLESELRRSYANISRATAKMQREAQTPRVDSAYSRLRAAELALRNFSSRNRSLSAYALHTIEYDELAREVEVAKQFYLQAVTDRDGAEARALEDAPIVVTIDPVPKDMPLTDRLLTLKVLLASVAAGIVTVLAIYILHSWRTPILA